MNTYRNDHWPENKSIHAADLLRGGTCGCYFFLWLLLDFQFVLWSPTLSTDGAQSFSCAVLIATALIPFLCKVPRDVSGAGAGGGVQHWIECFGAGKRDGGGHWLSANNKWNSISLIFSVSSLFPLNSGVPISAEDRKCNLDNWDKLGCFSIWDQFRVSLVDSRFPYHLCFPRGQNPGGPFCSVGSANPLLCPPLGHRKFISSF